MSPSSHTPVSYVVLDAARMFDNIETAAQLNADHVSLYRNRKEEPLASVAPYLFTYATDTEFASWLASDGWGNSWGIYLHTAVKADALHQHLSKFLLVDTEDGDIFYFRFYDPRVLRVFLPTCDTKQLQEFFGPISYFMMEDDDPSQALVFSLRNGALHTEVIPAPAPMGLKTQPNE